jgi:hypothetical protein
MAFDWSAPTEQSQRSGVMVRVVSQSLLAISLAVFCLSARPAAAQAIPSPLVSVVDINVESVDFENGGLIANAVVELDVAGQTITRDVEIPLILGATPGEGDACDILNLALGPVNLDVLGLVVTLDDCEGGPVTVDITATEEGLVGPLLCDLAGGLLDPDAILANLLDDLTDDQLAVLTGALTQVLNDVLDELLASETATAAQHASGGGANHRCDILTLEIPDGIHLDIALLGLHVDTSGICLDVFAERGPGNLLGNLLCGISNLLDNRGNNIGGQQALLRKLLRVVEVLVDGD